MIVLATDLFLEFRKLRGLVVNNAFQHLYVRAQPLDFSFEFPGAVVGTITEKQNDEGNQNQRTTSKAHGTPLDQN